MRVGFTGTQEGMTEEQIAVLLLMIKSMTPFEFHHGDCVGSDAEAHVIVHALGIPICIHPPMDTKKRAFCDGAREIRAPLPYLERNKEIVVFSDVLIATPKSKQEHLRSGTWSTVRYARQRGKTVWIINPDGSILSNAPLPAEKEK